MRFKLNSSASRSIALKRFLPFLRWWPRVGKETLRADSIAGLTGALIVIPQGVAFATIAGMPPQYGLYAAMVPAIVAALFGSSWHLVSGPTTAISIVVFATISPLAPAGSPEYIRLVLTLAFLTGVFELMFGLARMGALVNFISHTVVIGFTAGAALLIAANQLKSFFGVEIPPGSGFFDITRAFVAQAGQINGYVTAVAVVTLLASVATKRFLPKIPYMIAGMIIGSIFAVMLDQAYSNQVTGVRFVGALPEGLPPLSLPDLSLEALREIAPIAIAVSMLALTEAVSIARSIAIKSEQRIDGNQEFVGQGLSNIFGSFFSAYPSSGSFNRSGLNFAADARTPLAAVFSALFLLAFLLAVAPLAKYLPIPAMAAILMLVAYGLIDFHHIASTIRTSRHETAVLVVTFIATLTVHLEYAIYTGVLLSLLLYLNRTSRPLIVDVKPDPAECSYHFSASTGLPDCCQLKMLRINGSLFFGAANHVEQALQGVDEAKPQQKHLLIASRSINFVDLPGADVLAREAKRRRKLGGGLYFYRLRSDIVQELRDRGQMKDLGEANFFPVKSDVIGQIYPKLDSEICRTCEARIFKECHVALPNGEPRET